MVNPIFGALMEMKLMKAGNLKMLTSLGLSRVIFEPANFDPGQNTLSGG